MSPSWEVTSGTATKEFHTILWKTKVHYLVHKSRHWSLSSNRLIQCIPPHYSSLRFILILSSLLCLGLPSGLFPSGIRPHYRNVHDLDDLSSHTVTISLPSVIYQLETYVTVSNFTHLRAAFKIVYVRYGSLWRVSYFHCRKRCLEDQLPRL
jgi:sensor histidine kinase YesM